MQSLIGLYLVDIRSDYLMLALNNNIVELCFLHCSYGSLPLCCFDNVLVDYGQILSVELGFVSIDGRRAL